MAKDLVRLVYNSHLQPRFESLDTFPGTIQDRNRSLLWVAQFLYFLRVWFTLLARRPFITSADQFLGAAEQQRVSGTGTVCSQVWRGRDVSASWANVFVFFQNVASSSCFWEIPHTKPSKKNDQPRCAVSEKCGSNGTWMHLVCQHTRLLSCLSLAFALSLNLRFKFYLQYGPVLWLLITWYPHTCTPTTAKWGWFWTNQGFQKVG